MKYTDGKYACLIRHADRDPFPEGSLGNEVLLNAQGIQKARQLGAHLKEKKINAIYTSPVERCLQTAV
ncbi:MAG: histidine phosphatase family protein [Bacteroidia bacterium]